MLLSPETVSAKTIWRIIIAGIGMTFGLLCRSNRYKVLVWQYCACFRGLLEIGPVESTVETCVSPY